MIGLVCAIFATPMTVTGLGRMLMLVPLCLSISIVYKTVKTEDLKAMPLAAIALCVTIVLGMYAVGVGLWLLYLILA